MLGTDLNTAYFNMDYVPADKPIAISNNAGSQVQTMPPQVQTMPTAQVQLQPPSPPPPPAPPVYDATPPTSIAESPLSDPMLQELQLELLRQKASPMMTNNSLQKDPSSINSESLIDRYASKKKDVFKLVNISFSVLLAMSVHFVAADIVRTYLRNNDFTYNKETIIKFMYPLGVLLIMWSFKVFNK